MAKKNKIPVIERFLILGSTAAVIAAGGAATVSQMGQGNPPVFADVDPNAAEYADIAELKELGLISGDDDGNFHPDDLITRAEFVQMVGYKTDERRTDAVKDLSRLHWAYTPLMYSPLPTQNGLIRPNDYISKLDAYAYLYRCYGKEERDIPIPGVVKNGFETFVYSQDAGSYDFTALDALPWAYEHGLLSGGKDGLTFALSGQLRKGEAAVLANRARDCADVAVDFQDTVDDSILEYAYENCMLFDNEYVPDETLTNVELAEFVWRMTQTTCNGWDYDTHEWRNQTSCPHSDHHVCDTEDSRLECMGYELRFCLGDETIKSVEEAERVCVAEDGFAMLGGGFSNLPLVVSAWGAGDDTPTRYTDAKPSNNRKKAGMNLLAQIGAYPYAGGKIHSGEPLTKKTVAAIVYMMDRQYGVIRTKTLAYLYEGHGFTTNQEGRASLNYDFDNFPQRSEYYGFVLSGVPGYVYSQPFYERGQAVPDTKEQDDEYNPLQPAYGSCLPTLSAINTEDPGTRLQQYDFYWNAGSGPIESGVKTLSRDALMDDGLYTEVTWTPSLTYQTPSLGQIIYRARVRQWDIKELGFRLQDIYALDYIDDDDTTPERKQELANIASDFIEAVRNNEDKAVEHWIDIRCSTDDFFGGAVMSID